MFSLTVYRPGGAESLRIPDEAHKSAGPSALALVALVGQYMPHKHPTPHYRHHLGAKVSVILF